MVHTLMSHKLCLFQRAYVWLDPPHHALGYRTPKISYNPLFDEKLSDAQRHSKFVSWNSSYFIHSPSSLDLDSSLRDPIDGLEQHTPDPLKPSTMNNISSADIGAGLDSNALEGDTFLILPQARPVFQEIRLRAMFGDMNETSVPIALPKVAISYVWCTQSVWETVLAARLLKAEIASPPGYHYPIRRVKFFMLKGNHFVRPYLYSWLDLIPISDNKGTLGQPVAGFGDICCCH